MLPETNTNFWDNDGLEPDFEETEEKSNTYQIDMETKTISSKCDGIEAVKQAIYLILGTERYENCIYSWNYGVELQSLMGMPKSYCIPELQRRITEALEQDERIESVDDFKFAEEGNKIMAAFTVNTIYGELNMEKVVDI